MEILSSIAVAIDKVQSETQEEPVTENPWTRLVKAP